MKYLKRFNESESENKHNKIPDGFTGNDMNLIQDNIPSVRKPMSWEEVEESSVDLDDLNDDVLKALFKLPVYNVTDLNEVFHRVKEDYLGLLTPDEHKSIYDELYSGNITDNNYIFYEELKIPYQIFIIRFQMKNIDCGLLVDTQGFSYMRYVSLIKEFGDMYDYYKKDLELRNSTPNS
jgi:hypothetical protein